MLSFFTCLFQRPNLLVPQQPPHQLFSVPSSSASFGGADNSSQGNDDNNPVVCSCGIPARLLTVRKEGPNQGILNKFYLNSLSRNSACDGPFCCQLQVKNFTSVAILRTCATSSFGKILPLGGMNTNYWPVLLKFLFSKYCSFLVSPQITLPSALIQDWAQIVGT